MQWHLGSAGLFEANSPAWATLSICFYMLCAKFGYGTLKRTSKPLSASKRMGELQRESTLFKESQVQIMNWLFILAGNT